MLNDLEAELDLGEEVADFDSDGDGPDEIDIGSAADLQKDQSTSTSQQTLASTGTDTNSDPSPTQPDKAAELKAIKEKPGPLHLLKLPVDILRIIFDEVRLSLLFTFVAGVHDGLELQLAA